MVETKERETIYLGEGSVSEMRKLQAVLGRGGVRSEILPTRDCATRT